MNMIYFLVSDCTANKNKKSFNQRKKPFLITLGKNNKKRINTRNKYEQLNNLFFSAHKRKWKAYKLDREEEEEKKIQNVYVVQEHQQVGGGQGTRSAVGPDLHDQRYWTSCWVEFKKMSQYDHTILLEFVEIIFANTPQANRCMRCVGRWQTTYHS